MATYSTNTTIKNNGGWLDLNTLSFVLNGNTTTAAVVGIVPSGEAWELNGTTTATIAGATTGLFLQYTFDNGANWYDVASYAGNTGTAYTYTFTKFKLGQFCGFRWRKVNGASTASTSTSVMSSKTINTP